MYESEELASPSFWLVVALAVLAAAFFCAASEWTAIRTPAGELLPLRRDRAPAHWYYRGHLTVPIYDEGTEGPLRGRHVY